jgi:phospholipase A-2-activating protein
MIHILQNSESYLICGTQRGQLIVYKVDGNQISQVKSFAADDQTISDIAYLNQSQFAPTPCIATSSRSGTVSIWTFEALLASEPTPLHTINSTTQNVCNILPMNDGRILCSSWDNISRIESPSGSIQLSHGSFSAWCGAEFPSGIVTADANGTLRLFDYNGTELNVYEKAHSASIRAAKVYNGNLLLVGNDGILSEWTVTNEFNKIRSLDFKTSALFAIQIIGSTAFVGGEDPLIFVVDLNTFKIIDVLPTGSPTWSIAALPNGDIAAGTSVGILLLFTLHHERRASIEIEDQYLKRVASTPFPPAALQSLNLRTLPSRPNPKTPIGSACPISIRGGVAFMSKSVGYGRFVQLGMIRQTASKIDPQGNEYNESITIIPLDNIPRQLYANFGKSIRETALAFIQLHNLNPGVIDEIVSFLQQSFPKWQIP